jgi:hypothetical protein
MALGSYLCFGVLTMPAGDLKSKVAIKAAGCTHTAVAAYWATLQPNGPGTALVPSAVATLLQDYQQAAAVGLKVFLTLAIANPPTWVISGQYACEAYTDQAGNVYQATTAPSGKQVTNWIWTALGWQYIADFINKLAAALGPVCVAQTAYIKCGGGYYGELHYPRFDTGALPNTMNTPPYSHWGYGNSMQTGVGLAAGQVVCPLPGYTIFSGTPAQDALWLNWYLNGIGTWVLFFIATMRAAGWNCEYNMCHPGGGIRWSWNPWGGGTVSSQYQESSSPAEDPVRIMSMFAHDPKVWPYPTWESEALEIDPVISSADVAPWKYHYATAYYYNKHFRIWGENSGGENAAALQAIFAGAAYGGSCLSGNPWLSSPPQTYGFQGIMWLSYQSLTSGLASDAQLSDLAAAIAGHVATL